jgi:hypothetical protein
VKPRRAGSIQRIGCMVVALCTAAIGLGCDRGPARQDRYARRFLPTEPHWRLESEIPAKPQKTPMMVIWELSRIAPYTPPTLEQQRAADDLIERSHAAVQAHGWDDYEKGIADGFKLMPDDDRHYMNEEFLLDDRILDPERPEFLMYYSTPDGMELAGLMFYVRSIGEWGPQIGGPLTIWHYHVWSRKRCLRQDVIPVGFLKPGEDCPGGEIRHESDEMMHVWLVDHPNGPFATRMYINPALLPRLLARRMRERGY